MAQCLRDGTQANGHGEAELSGSERWPRLEPGAIAPIKALQKGQGSTDVALTNGEPDWESIGSVIGRRLHAPERLSGRAWRVRSQGADGSLESGVFKWLNHQETVWYRDLRPTWGSRYALVPRVLRFEPQPYVLLPDLGPSLKMSLPALSSGDQQARLKRVVTQLAEMHARGRAPGAVWQRRGQLPDYSLASSEAWSHAALAAIDWLGERGCQGAREQSRILRIQSHAVSAWLRRWLGRVVPLTLIHGDPHLGNWVRGDDDRFYLIDWEYMSLGMPLRDLTVLFQDVWNLAWQQELFALFKTLLADAGWSVEDPIFTQAYEASRFDNTLMMLGFEIRQYQRGGLSRHALGQIWKTKLGWIEEAFERLASDL